MAATAHAASSSAGCSAPWLLARAKDPSTTSLTRDCGTLAAPRIVSSCERRAVSLSCTLIGPQSSPDDSNAARTATACFFSSAVIVVGLDFGRLLRGSSAAACPSTSACLRIA